jgi:hypothetical protein
MSKSLPLLVLSLCILCFWACSTEGCDEELDVFLRSTIYESGTGEQFTLDSITIFGLNRADSTIYLMDELNEVNLPLDPSGISSVFIIQSGTKVDTLEVSYISYPYYLSKSCGYIYRFEIDEIFYTSSGIDTILIINSLVNNNDEENLRTFF